MCLRFIYQIIHPGQPLRYLEKIIVKKSYSEQYEYILGQDINQYHFHQKDFKSFHHHLTEETELLKNWFLENHFVDETPKVGFELETWLIDRDGNPAPRNEDFLNQLQNPMVVPELAKFNIEINSTPFNLNGKVFSLMQKELETTLGDCRTLAKKMGLDIVHTGILPTIKDKDLSLSNISPRQRYRALNEQVLRMRKGRPIEISISGEDDLKFSHLDVMPEAAATSLQIHLQVSPNKAKSLYNASLALAAPFTALCANSPFLFGKSLWAETRIPLFEQSVSVNCDPDSPDRNRVTFGSGYIQESMLECFIENLETYGVLLPITFESPGEYMTHLRLHNGTIWRWIRPIIGFEKKSKKPHLRVEFRTIAAGPSIVDTVADIAFFVGSVHFLTNPDIQIDSMVSFNEARDNFYRAAQFGLKTYIKWKGKNVNIIDFLKDYLFPIAEKGLEQLEIIDGKFYLEIIKERLCCSQNGSKWQLELMKKKSLNMHEILQRYREFQNSGIPVSKWKV